MIVDYFRSTFVHPCLTGLMVCLVLILPLKSLEGKSLNKKNQTLSARINYHFQTDPVMEQLIQANTKRQIFLQAEQALRAKKYKKFHHLLRQLGDYPLRAYLLYQRMKQILYYANNAELRSYLQQNQNTPYAALIRKRWLDHLARKKRWQSYIAFYQPQPSVRRQCNYAMALINNGQIEKTRQFIDNLWLSARSQPKSCDPVFKRWEQAGYLTASLRWQRIALVMKKGRTRLARYLAKPLPQKDRDFLDLWISLSRHPMRLPQSLLLQSKHHMRNQALTHIIYRQTRKDPQKATRLFQQLNKKQILDKDQKQQIYAWIGLSLVKKKQAIGWQWLDRIDTNHDNLYISKWRVRAAIIADKPKMIISAIKRLPKAEQKQQAWRYWRAYALAQQGQKHRARKILRKLAAERGYYAFLAADKVKQKYAFNHHPLTLGASTLETLRQQRGVQAAYEFLMLGKITEAKREWYYLTHTRLDETQNIAAAKLASVWGWTDRVILTLANTTQRDDILLRFPLRYEKTVQRFSLQYHLQPAYTFAVIRRESAFAVDARSPVGARGLMQIMPASARHIARRHKLPYRYKKQLYSASLNIHMGTAYLRDLLDKYDDKPILASAAYNAGPKQVKRWLNGAQDMTAIGWVETIPFTETRNYVKAILSYWMIYAHQLNSKLRLRDIMRL